MRAPSVWKGQSARVFVGLVLLLSLLLFFLAERFDQANHPAVSGTLSHLAAMLLAAFVASVFFSFREIRELIAASLSSLLLDGEISKHLSSKHRSSLRRKLLLEDLEDRVELLEPHVLERLEAVQEQCLVLPHLHNFASTITLTDIPDKPDLLYHHELTSYSVSCRHLKDSKGKYKILVGTELSNPAATLDTDILKKFSVRAGSKTFQLADATITKSRSAGLDIIHVSFDRDVDVDKELDVIVEVESVSSSSDPTEIRFVRYPTDGFRCTLVYRDDMSYDAAWFRGRAPAMPSAQVAREEVEVTPKGITAYTHQWLLPGDGVVLFWFPKPDRTSATPLTA